MSTLLDSKTPQQSTPIQPLPPVTTVATVDQILQFWFRGNPTDKDYKYQLALWFRAGPQLDAEIKRQFEATLTAAAAPQSALVPAWSATARGSLALIVLFDTFARRIYSGTPRMFALEAAAVGVVQQLLARSGAAATATAKADPASVWSLSPIERYFVYVALQHHESEKSVAQAHALMSALAEEMMNTPQRNQFERLRNACGDAWQMIKRFGRDPARNTVLERKSTEAEEQVRLGPAALSLGCIRAKDIYSKNLSVGG
jgi:uncharacterized protein (DUF924 family)